MDKLKSFVKTIVASEFEREFLPLLTNKQSFVAYFTGDVDKNTGKSWCPDCDISKPNVEEAMLKLEGKENILFVKMPVERSDWRDQGFIYRIHPKLKVNKVPTLMFFSNGQEYGRLVEDELADKDNVLEFIEQVLA